MNTLIKFPFYAKASLLLIGLYLFVTILYISQDFLLPFIYALIMAILASPIIDFFVKRKVNRTLAISFVMLFMLLLLVGLIFIIASIASKFKEALPNLELKANELFDQILQWISVTFDISDFKIKSWIKNSKSDLFKNSNAAIGNTLTSVGGIISTAILTPVYMYMLLFYQSHLVKFVHKVFGAVNDNKVSEILTETKSIIQSYLVGLFIDFLIVVVLNSIGLLLLGIEYAILLGIIGGLLNVIPYLGGLITMVLFALIALVTKTPEYVFYTIALYGVIQFIENNYLVPKIVGSKVKLNALISFIAVIIGAAIWGIPGMFLSIPFTAIIKIIFDRMEALKPWGFLLGDTVSEPIKINFKKILNTK